MQRTEKKDLIELCRDGKIEEVKELLLNDINLDIQNKFGMTALMMSSTHDYKEIVKLLLLNGANVDIQCKNGRNVLNLALLCGNKEIVKLLEKHQYEINKNKRLNKLEEKMMELIEEFNKLKQ